MQKRLRWLFDYQKFQRDPRLDAIIADVESRYGGAVADDDLEFVSAAGGMDVRRKDLKGMSPLSSREEWS